MQFSLTELTGVMQLIGTMSYYTLPLLLSFAIPAIYLAFKKLGTASDSGSGNFLDRIMEVISLPKIDSWVLILSLGLFVLGCITLKVGERKKETLRNHGWGVKNYLINTNQYASAIWYVESNTKIKKCTLFQLAKEYPNEFSLIPDNSGDSGKYTFILTDSIMVKKIIQKSEKLLDAFMSNEKDTVAFDVLFKKDNFFTYRVVYQLIADSSHKYSFIQMPPDTLKYAITKKTK